MLNLVPSKRFAASSSLQNSELQEGRSLVHVFEVLVAAVSRDFLPLGSEPGCQLCPVFPNSNAWLKIVLQFLRVRRRKRRKGRGEERRGEERRKGRGGREEDRRGEEEGEGRKGRGEERRGERE